MRYQSEVKGWRCRNEADQSFYVLIGSTGRFLPPRGDIPLQTVRTLCTYTLTSHVDLHWPAVLCPLQRVVTQTRNIRLSQMLSHFSETAGSRPGCDPVTSAPPTTASFIFYTDSNCTLDEGRSIALLVRTDESACSGCSVLLEWNTSRSVFI